MLISYETATGHTVWVTDELTWMEEAENRGVAAAGVCPGAATPLSAYMDNAKLGYWIASWEDWDTMEAEEKEKFLDKVWRRYHHLPLIIGKTEDVLIREFAEEDIRKMACIDSLPDVLICLGLNQVLAEEDFIPYMTAYVQQMYSFWEWGLWAVFNNGVFCGIAGLELRQEEWALGFWIEPAFRKQGIGYEAGRLILTYLREQTDLQMLCAFVETGNTPSVKLLQKLGFKKRSGPEEQMGQPLLEMQYVIKE